MMNFVPAGVMDILQGGSRRDVNQKKSRRASRGHYTLEIQGRSMRRHPFVFIYVRTVKNKVA